MTLWRLSCHVVRFRRQAGARPAFRYNDALASLYPRAVQTASMGPVTRSRIRFPSPGNVRTRTGRTDPPGQTRFVLYGPSAHDPPVKDVYHLPEACAFLDLCQNYEMDYPLPKYNGLF